MGSPREGFFFFALTYFFFLFSDVVVSHICEVVTTHVHGIALVAYWSECFQLQRLKHRELECAQGQGFCLA